MSDAHLQLVISECLPAVEGPLEALVVNTAVTPLPPGGGARFIAKQGERLLEVTLDDSDAPLRDVATLSTYLQMFLRFDWLMAATPSEFDAGAAGLSEVLGIPTGPSLLLTLQFSEGGTYSGLAITAESERGGWQVVMPNADQDDGVLAEKLFRCLGGEVDESTFAARLNPQLRQIADAFITEAGARRRS